MYSKFTASTTVLPGKCVLTAQGRRDAGTLCFLHVEPGHWLTRVVSKTQNPKS